MSKFCCISDFIIFIVKKGEKITKGSVHEEDFYSARFVGTHDSKHNDNMDAESL